MTPIAAEQYLTLEAGGFTYAGLPSRIVRAIHHARGAGAPPELGAFMRAELAGVGATTDPAGDDARACAAFLGALVSAGRARVVKYGPAVRELN